MKKSIWFSLVLFLLFPIGIYAEEEDALQKLQLIPATDTSTVDLVDYTYRDFTYINDVERKTYGVLKFDFVKNKRATKQPLAIDFLLFDENKINIGFVAYCTTKDLTGEYAQVTVNGGGGSPLTVFVDSSYLVKGHTKDDIAYIAVLDSNSNCYVGNSNKYAGLTIEEIASGKVSPDWNENDFINIFSFILNVGIYTFIGILLVIVALYVTFVALIVYLSKKMYDKKIPLKFVPGINFIYSLKIAFGRVVAFFGILALIGGIYLATESNFIILYIFLGMTGLSVLVNIYKFFSKNYDFMYFEPFIKNDGSDPIYYWLKVKVRGTKKAEQIINLNYSDSDLNSLPVSNDKLDTTGFVPVQVPDSKEEIIEKLVDNNTPSPEKEGFGIQKLGEDNLTVEANSAQFVEPNAIVAVSNSAEVEEKTDEKKPDAVQEEVPQEVTPKDTSKDDFMDMFQ